MTDNEVALDLAALGDLLARLDQRSPASRAGAYLQMAIDLIAEEAGLASRTDFNDDFDAGVSGNAA